jgi:hypothetical protein
MAPAASTTDVWYCRAAHCGLAVRLVQFTPAANTREPGRWHRMQSRMRGRRSAARAELLIQVAAVARECAHSAVARTHVRYAHTHKHPNTDTREDAIRWRCTNTRTHAHKQGQIARTHARTRTDVCAHEHTFTFTRHTDARAHKRRQAHKHTFTGRARTRTRTPKDPLKNLVPLIAKHSAGLALSTP